MQRWLTLAMNVADDLEHWMGIEQRWTHDIPDYQRAEQQLKHWQFIRAVEDIEVLIVQQLFELAKANLAGTGNNCFWLYYVTLLY